MSKFNTTATVKTLNISGHEAYRMTDKEKLVTQVLTSFINEKKFYGDNTDELIETLTSVINSDPKFVSKLAVFARREFGMRSVSHVLTAYLAHEAAGKPYVRDTVYGITMRGDDVTELLSFYINTFGKPIPNSLKKGISDVFTGFDEYTLAKYKGDKKALKMRDVICLCRPTPKDDEQSALWKRCIEGKLEIPVTWETELSANGNNKETWEKLIASGKVGYMALLRNLSNIINAEPDNIEDVWRTIEDPEKVKRSKQLPFRFLSAYRAIADVAGSRAFEALEKAVSASVENMPKLGGTTVIAVDGSGSMDSRISRRSDVTCYDIAMMLGLLANRICDNCVFYRFNSGIYKYQYPQSEDILNSVLTSPRADGGTVMELPFDTMINEKIKADRVIILSDNECNSSYGSPVQSTVDEYRDKIGKDVWVHAIDLMGYGTQQFCGSRFNLIAGWSDKVLDFIKLAEEGWGSIIQRVSDYIW